MKYEIRKIEKVENPIGRVLGRSNNNANANAGVAYANTHNAASNSNTNNGGRLCIIAALLLESRSRDGLTFRNNRCYGVHLRDRCWLTARDSSLGNSMESWKAKTSQSVVDYGQVAS